jgi:membrane protease YdiL (CAAX protease family)
MFFSRKVSILGIVAAMALAGGLVPADTGSTSAPSIAWASAESMLYIVLLLPAFALQASTEEILFRGWLLSVVAKKLDVLLAVLLSSALFTLAHLSRDQHWLVTASNFLFAVFCCAWVLRTRSILGVMGWHAGWNWMLAVGFGVPVTGIDVGIPSLFVTLTSAGPEWLSGGAEGPEGSVICVAYFIAGSLALWFWSRGGTQGVGAQPASDLHLADRKVAVTSNPLSGDRTATPVLRK